MAMRARVAEPPAAWPGPDPEVDLDGPIAARPLQALLDDAVQAGAEAPCIDFLGRRYRYRDMAGLVAHATRGLQAIGVFPGTRVGLLLPNTPYFVILYYAVLKAGGVDLSETRRLALPQGQMAAYQSRTESALIESSRTSPNAGTRCARSMTS